MHGWRSPSPLSFASRGPSQRLLGLRLALRARAPTRCYPLSPDLTES